MGTLRTKRRFDLPALRALMGLLLLLVSQAALAAEAKQSLEEIRLGVIKGTTPGIVILDFGSTKSPAPAASASAGVQAGPVEAAPSASWASRWLSKLPLPSGRSLHDARRLDAPDQGIPVPTAASASQPMRPKAVP